MAQRIELVFGTAHIADEKEAWGVSDNTIFEAFNILKRYGVRKLDTAQRYQESEDKLGAIKAGTEHRFVIDTKWAGGYAGLPNASSRENMVSTAKESLSKLGVDKVDIFYIHSPDFQTPLESTLAGVDQAYKEGLFERFGLSNYPPEEVEKVYDLCKAHGYVLPSVYQGNYSAFARKQENLLFPVLRKCNMAFYAYSPIAGGFLAKTRQQIEAGTSRFSQDQMYGIYHSMYVKPSFLSGLEKWEQVAQAEGIPRVEMAYRWITYHSHLDPAKGDGLVLGASSPAQLEQTLKACDRGPLSDKAIQDIDAIWADIEPDAVLDNYQDVMNRVAARKT